MQCATRRLCWIVVWHICRQGANRAACGGLRQPQIARGSLLWEQIYPQEPDGRPVASPTGAALPGTHTPLLTLAPCKSCAMGKACLRTQACELLSLGMLIAALRWDHADAVVSCSMSAALHS